MNEIETKIYNIDRKKVEEKLISLGASKVLDDDNVRSVFFDFPGSPLKKERRQLRLRMAGGKTTITFKSPHASDKEGKDPNIKAKYEHEIIVSDFDEARKILKSLGLVEWLDFKKHRTSYLLDGVRFEFDRFFGEYAKLPEFMEIEAKDHETVYKYAMLLGFSKKDCISAGPFDVIGKKV